MYCTKCSVHMIKVESNFDKPSDERYICPDCARPQVWRKVGKGSLEGMTGEGTISILVN